MAYLYTSFSTEWGVIVIQRGWFCDPFQRNVPEFWVSWTIYFKIHACRPIIFQKGVDIRVDTEFWNRAQNMLLVMGVVPPYTLMGLFKLQESIVKKVCLKCIIIKEFRSADIVLVDCKKQTNKKVGIVKCIIIARLEKFLSRSTLNTVTWEIIFV